MRFDVETRKSNPQSKNGNEESDLDWFLRIAWLKEAWVQQKSRNFIRPL